MWPTYSFSFFSQLSLTPPPPQTWHHWHLLGWNTKFMIFLSYKLSVFVCVLLHIKREQGANIKIFLPFSHIEQKLFGIKRIFPLIFNFHFQFPKLYLIDLRFDIFWMVLFRFLIRYLRLLIMLLPSFFFSILLVIYYLMYQSNVGIHSFQANYCLMSFVLFLISLFYCLYFLGWWREKAGEGFGEFLDFVKKNMLFWTNLKVF